MRSLSGGNQQKVVLGKWLLRAPKALILDEPTRGIDVGAKAEIYAQIQRLARGGAAVLVIASEFEELFGICDRILAMAHGEIVAEFSGPVFDRKAVLAAAMQTPSRGFLRCKPSRQTLKLTLLRATPAIMFVVILVLFSTLSPRFLSLQNFANILTQSAYMAVMAIGMTFVLLIAGVDLSIGAAMYVSATILILYCPLVAGSRLDSGDGLPRRGFRGDQRDVHRQTESHPVRRHDRDAVYRARFGPVSVRHQDDPGAETVLSFGEGAWLGVSYAIWTLAILFVVAFWIERWTPFGRYLYAMGADFDGARKAGIPVWGMSFAVYVLVRHVRRRRRVHLAEPDGGGLDELWLRRRVSGDRRRRARRDEPVRRAGQRHRFGVRRRTDPDGAKRARASRTSIRISTRW